jgi:hypothetical protein
MTDGAMPTLRSRRGQQAWRSLLRTGRIEELRHEAISFPAE